MKKVKFILIVLAILLALFLIGSLNKVDAATFNGTPIESVGEEKFTVDTNADGSIKITLKDNITGYFVIEKNDNIYLDLNGKTLTNTASKDTIFVENGATLDIGGEGTILTKAPYGYAGVFNNGTVYIGNAITQEELNFTVEKASAEDKEYYVIVNHGNMELVCVNITSEYQYSSLIENGYYNFNSGNSRTGYVEGVNQIQPYLRIGEGTFKGGLNTVKNDDNGYLIITGGTFENTCQAAVANFNYCIIEDGEFTSTRMAILDASIEGSDYNSGTLFIEGGTFKAPSIIEGQLYNGKYNNPGTIEIYDGEFEYTTFINLQSVSSDFDVNEKVTYYGKELVENEDGNLTLEDVDYSKVNELIDKFEALDKSKYTSESYKKLEDAVNEVKADLANGSDEVDDMANKIQNAMDNLQLIENEKQNDVNDIADSQDENNTIIENKETDKQDENVKTGNINIGLIIAITLAVISAVGLIVIRKIRK